MKTVTINSEQQLFVIPSGDGFTCLGFMVCENKIQKLCKELDKSPVAYTIGTMDQYETYTELVDSVRRLHVDTGFRSSSELNPKLIGLEHRRIECKLDGKKIKFYVGKSTGWIPCHLQIKTSRSHGGMSISNNPDSIKNIRVLS